MYNYDERYNFNMEDDLKKNVYRIKFSDKRDFNFEIRYCKIRSKTEKIS
jgi:hypothetical protein